MSGRKTSLTDEVQNRIIQFVRAGATVVQACQACGISQTSFYKWMQTGREAPGTKFGAFSRAVEVARSEAIVVAETTVHREDPKFWLTHGPARDAGWSQRLEITGADGGPIEIMPARELIAERLSQTNRRIVEVPRPVELPEALEG